MKAHEILLEEVKAAFEKFSENSERDEQAILLVAATDDTKDLWQQCVMYRNLTYYVAQQIIARVTENAAGNCSYTK